MAFMLLYFGVEAFNDLMSDKPWTPRLERIARQTGLEPDEEG
ncbi:MULTISPECIES: hypothetical protein [unclassified Streptomyces]|nr:MULTISPECIES: hypothetical protein [unclassified Streptomyces]MDX3427092.1 hypothetical protein [Streptomyces sp. ME02-6985-2c]